MGAVPNGRFDVKIESFPVDSAFRPFPFVELTNYWSQAQADRVLDWLETAPDWQLQIASFYEQYEFSLLSSPPSGLLHFLVEEHFITKIASDICQLLDVKYSLTLVDVVAHKLTNGQTIRLHNDYIGSEESHRMVIHLNRGWSLTDGGVLMLFGSDRAEDVRFIIPPRHGSAFAFEISDRSFHAVSTIRRGARYSMVYTFCGDR